MNGVLGHSSAWQGYTGPGTTCANEMNYVMNHAPGAGSLARPVDLQSSVLPLYRRCSQMAVRDRDKVRVRETHTQTDRHTHACTNKQTNTHTHTLPLFLVQTAINYTDNLATLTQ